VFSTDPNPVWAIARTAHLRGGALRTADRI
jgi:hypothetical protein